MMEKSAMAGESGGRGVHAHPLSLYFPSCIKLQMYEYEYSVVSPVASSIAIWEP
jgi:hypothetical protein